MSDEEFIRREQNVNILRYSGRLREALAECALLVAARGEQASIWHTLAQTWLDLGQFDQELAARRVCIKIIGENGIDSQIGVTAYQQAALGLATALLRQGKFEEAWPYWETGRLGPCWTPVFGSKVWNGEEGGKLLVVCEGGYGDLFCFRRWLPWAAERVIHLGLMVHKGVSDIWDWSQFGVDQVVEVGSEVAVGEWDWSTSILSLPIYTASKGRELDVPVDSIERQRFTIGGRRRIGFCWRAEESGSPRKIRSLSVEEADDIVEGISGGGADVLSLSPHFGSIYGEHQQQEPELLIVEDDKINTWKKAISYISHLDFVLTVDTAVAHLAGLLQIPTLLLLPAASDWKYGVNRDWGPWYGTQLTYFRNADPVRWEVEKIVESVKECLK
jgi:hypothetical protein